MPKGIPNKRYTPEFKKLVVETMMKEKLSCRETARRFEISDHKCVAAWERIYLEEGAEGLAIERRGRSSKGRPPKKLFRVMQACGIHIYRRQIFQCSEVCHPTSHLRHINMSHVVHLRNSLSYSQYNPVDITCQDIFVLTTNIFVI